MYSDEILKVFPRLHFKSFQAFWDSMLVQCYQIFVSSNCNMRIMCSIVDAFGKFVLNQYRFIASCNSSQERSRYFSDADFRVVVDALKHFTKILINIEPATFEATFCVLGAFRRIMEGEQLISMNGLDVVPVTVAHLIPLTSSALILESYAKVLDGCIKCAEKRIRDEKNYVAFYLGSQITELYELLMHTPTKIGMPHLSAYCASYERVMTHPELKNSFKISRSLTFMPYTRLDKSGRWLTEPVMNKQRLAKHFPVLIELLTTVKKSKLNKTQN